MSPGVVVFDAVGTLIEPCPPAAEAYCQTAAEAGLQRDPQRVRRRLAEQIAAAERRAADRPTSAEQERQFWAGVIEAVLQPPPDVDLLDPLWQRFSRPQAWQVLPEVPETLSLLAADGWRLAVASNFDSRLRTLCRQLPELPRDLTVFCCDDVGWRKPHAKFYEQVHRRLPSGRRVMVGDDVEGDVLAPCRAGWSAVLIGRPDQPLPDGAAAIDRLAELPRVLAAL